MQKTIVVGLAGPKRAGKDDAAKILRQCTASYDAELYVGQLYFADPMYDMLKQFVDSATIDRLRHDDAKDTEIIEPFGCTLRHMAQTVGTEWGRNLIHPDAWVMSVERRIRQADYELPDEADAALVLIPDVRFANEAAFVRNNGILIHIDRPSVTDDAHASENGVAAEADDLVIHNHATLDDFQKQVYDYGNGLLHERITDAIYASG